MRARRSAVHDLPRLGFYGVSTYGVSSFMPRGRKNPRSVLMKTFARASILLRMPGEKRRESVPDRFMGGRTVSICRSRSLLASPWISETSDANETFESRAESRVESRAQSRAGWLNEGRPPRELPFHSAESRRDDRLVRPDAGAHRRGAPSLGGS